MNESPYAEQYHAHRAVMVPGLISIQTLAPILQLIDEATFEVDHKITSSNFHFHVIYAPLPSEMVSRLFDDPALIETLSAITQTKLLGPIEGSIKQLQSTPQSRFPWHADSSRGRHVAISINLSREPFSGGEFQIRNKWEKTPLCTLKPEKPGDCHVFDVSRQGLIHRICPVIGPAPRTFFAGWLRTV